MSRLKNYLESAKLARLHINTAKGMVEKESDLKALRFAVSHLCSAQESLLVSLNNFASLYFKAKPKR